ncbi:TIGR01777 family oxidoreductase [Methylomonas montana]|uniref:TIGR01777 family oxidoreductase n=1 Tax=Methylomonas montana TaxID=3058963 RepID=UPI00265AC2E2|nr:TIGR01777 family oxidoreductase [Methylomonas montana]WKJ88692.1 TIGR01777 family oxidoreductase [Methylomonas montana]
MSTNPILITGGTGFLGGALTRLLLQKNYSVTVLSRSAEKVANQFGNQVQAVTRIADLPDAGSCKAVVNLAGAGIFDQRWTPTRKQLLRDSRIKLTEQLVAWMAASSQPKPVLVNGSAIGIYGDQGDTPLNENSPSKTDFSQQLCADWESTALQAEKAGGRVCLIRTGLVLGKDGGILKRMLLPFRLGLGGRLGDGQQWMSWIHLHDWLAIVEAMISNPEMSGPYNATAPTPVSNREFSEALAQVLNRPMLLPMPAVLLKGLLGEMAELVLGSQRVLPKRLTAQGFGFAYPQLDAALRNILITP